MNGNSTSRSIWINIRHTIYWLCKKKCTSSVRLCGIFHQNCVKKLSAVRLKESKVTDEEVKFGRDQPFISTLGRCPPYSARGVPFVCLREVFALQCTWCPLRESWLYNNNNNFIQLYKDRAYNQDYTVGGKHETWDCNLQVACKKCSPCYFSVLVSSRIVHNIDNTHTHR